MTNAFLITDDDIIICDPEAEYFSLVQRLDGQVIRLRGLEAQKTEAENLQIVQLVRSMRLSPHELSAMLSGGGIPGMEAAPGYPAEPADHDTEEMEDTENE